MYNPPPKPELLRKDTAAMSIKEPDAIMFFLTC